MVWQDIVITIVMIFFSYALVPQIIKGFKEKRGLIAFQTALITSIGMFVITVTYSTINLIFSTIMALITGILWTILLIQGQIYKNN